MPVLGPEAPPEPASPAALPEDAEPSRVLGAGDVGVIVVGAIIGVGIFFTPSKVAAITGSPDLALLAWALAGLIALAGALTFAELGSMYRGGGAQYASLKDAFGALPAFLFVFCNATAIQAGSIGIIAIICAANLGPAVTGHELPQNQERALAAVLIGALAVVNANGASAGAKLQRATVVAKVAVLLAVAGAAAFVAPAVADAVARTDQPMMARPFIAVLSALVPAFFAYGGWQHALWIGGEVKDPERKVPRGLVGGVVVVVLVYLAVNAAYLRLLGVQHVATTRTLAVDAVGAAFPAVGARVVAGAVALSAFGVLNAQLLAGPRLLYEMARDGKFFASLGRLGGPAAAPIAAIVALAAMALMLLLVGREHVLEQVLGGVVFIDGLFFALTGVAVLVLRSKKADAPRPVRALGYPITPLVFIAGELGVVAGAYAEPQVRAAAYIGVAWICVGAVLYAFRFRDA